MRGLALASLVAVSLFGLAACEQEGGKKEGFVGNTYPHSKPNATYRGSPYEATDELDNRAGEQRDTSRVRGPSLVPPAPEQQAQQQQAPQGEQQGQTQEQQGGQK